MSTDMNKFYDPVIKAHNASPYHFQKTVNAPYTVKAYNPLCGDRYDFYADIREGKMVSLHFNGYGCAVSMAAGSVLVKSLEGKSINEAVAICDTYLSLLKGEERGEGPDEFRAFAVVKDFPARYDCAAMAWTEVRKFLGTQK